MPTPGITVDGLTKKFGAITAVDDVSFEVRKGAVTGFLGPNGAGKTTTLRMLLGLVQPTSGTGLVDGQFYRKIKRPGRAVGAALEASSFHPGRSARNHLRVLAPHLGVDDRRCDDVLELVGLAPHAHRRVGGYSLGMRQRLGLAAALLGDPGILILDEPANGLDPEGIVWLRQLLRHFASEGRTILVSSHVLSEVQHTVDDVVIIAKGRLVHASSLEGLSDLAEKRAYIETPDAEGLARLCAERRWDQTTFERGSQITGVEAAEVGAAAFAHGVEIHHLRDVGESLEQLFLKLTAEIPPDGPDDPAQAAQPAAAPIAEQEGTA